MKLITIICLICGILPLASFAAKAPDANQCYNLNISTRVLSAQLRDEESVDAKVFVVKSYDPKTDVMAVQGRVVDSFLSMLSGDGKVITTAKNIDIFTKIGVEFPKKLKAFLAKNPTLKVQVFNFEPISRKVTFCEGQVAQA